VSRLEGGRGRVLRDAVRSTKKRVVYAWGLNVVVVCPRVTPPWGGTPITLPINLRIHTKGGKIPLELTEEMIRGPATRPAAHRQTRPVAHRVLEATRTSSSTPGQSTRRPERTTARPAR